MQLAADDIRSAHERIGSPAEIVQQRRALYAAVVELGSDNADQPEPTADVLDNPVVRGHLGALLTGRERFAPDALRPLSGMVAPGFGVEVGGYPVRLASAPGAAESLAAVVRRVADELARHGDENAGLTLVTIGDARLAEVYDVLVQGVRLAARVAPALALDLLPHVALFAVADVGAAQRLGSASAREYPGMILIPLPETPLEVAEALVHEGAHQKFFDFGMTRSMLGARTPEAPPFRPSWAPPGAPPWPLEQAFAAWHAYSCLAAFDNALDASGEDTGRHSDSLLRKAAERAGEIGSWLRSHGGYLGADAHLLIAAFAGFPPDEGWVAEDVEADIRAAGDGGLLVRPCGSRTLVVRRDTFDLWWVADEVDVTSR
ncbi:hypothetical protein BJF78_13245 [Pseudonocardia sp. CNS-139]|nr:hypothetical protein BJF78_13245 [Pseudonocardia sp. CNS-139]